MKHPVQAVNTHNKKLSTHAYGYIMVIDQKLKYINKKYNETHIKQIDIVFAVFFEIDITVSCFKLFIPGLFRYVQSIALFGTD